MIQKFNADMIQSMQKAMLKMHAEKIEKIPDSTEISVIRKDSWELIEVDNTKCSLKLCSKVGLKPESLFSLYIEYAIQYEFKQKIDKKFINKNVEQLLHPLGSEISYIIGSITKFIFNDYLILPPAILIDEKPKKK